MNKQAIENAIRTLKSDGYIQNSTVMKHDAAVNLAVEALQQQLLFINAELPQTMENTATDISRVYGEGYRRGFEDCRQQLTNGWISIDSRLPSREEYQKNDGRFIVTDGNRRYQSLFNIYENRFEKEVHNIRLIIEDKCVVAWQPLPPAYKEVSE